MNKLFEKKEDAPEKARFLFDIIEQQSDDLKEHLEVVQMGENKVTIRHKLNGFTLRKETRETYMADLVVRLDEEGHRLSESCPWEEIGGDVYTLGKQVLELDDKTIENIEPYE